MSVRLVIHSTGNGACSLTGKDASDGLTVTFEDGTVKQSFLSWKAFRQLLTLKAGQVTKEVAAAKPGPTANDDGTITIVP